MNSSTRFPHGRFKTFQSFQTKGYRIFLASQIGQWASMSMQMLARSLLVYRITGTGASIGILALANAIPMILIGLFGGAIADRFQKKYILAVCNIVSGLITLSVAITLTLGYLGSRYPASWWILVFAAAAQGIVMGLITPARMAIIPEIVGQERVMNAISLASMGQTGFQLAGPTCAGFLIDAYGFSAVYYFMAFTFVISAIFAMILPRTRTTSTGRHGSTFKDVLEGFRYIRREKVFALIVAYGFCHMVSGKPYQQLLAIFSEEILNVGASGLGILMTVAGVGALGGSLLLASLPNRKRGLLLLFSGIVMSIPLIVFSFSKSWYLSLLMMPLIGMGPAMHGALTGTLIQYYADPDYRGRMQTFTVIGTGLASFSTFFVGVMTDAIGVQWAVGAMAMFLTAVTVLFFLFSRRITRLE